MNLNEVVDKFPTGFPMLPVVGFGGGFGAELLQQASFRTTDPAMAETVMTALPQQHNEGTGLHLAMLGLEKTGTDDVTVSINGRPLTTCDPEHGCCVTCYYFERKPGCAKGSSNCPRLCVSSCHPIRSLHFEEEQASVSLYKFVEAVETGQWSKESSLVDAIFPQVESPSVPRRNRRHLPTNPLLSRKRKRTIDGENGENEGDFAKEDVDESDDEGKTMRPKSTGETMSPKSTVHAMSPKKTGAAMR
jgi:hypothetical protein